MINNLYYIKKFVDLVRIRPAIYNHRLGEHNDIKLIERLWQEIAVEMQTTPLKCRKKWASLRNGLTRQMRNEKEFETLGAGITRKSWYLADHMSFLRNYLCHKRTISPCNTNGDGESFEDKNDCTMDYDSNSFSSAKQDFKNENIDSEENDNIIEIDSDSSQSATIEDGSTNFQEQSESDDIKNYFKESFTLKRSHQDESPDQIDNCFKSLTTDLENRSAVAQPSNDIGNRLKESSYSKSHQDGNELKEQRIVFSNNLSLENKDRYQHASASAQPLPEIEIPIKVCPHPKRSRQQENELEDQNITFFTSILPDISKLTERRRRIFKQEVLSLLNKSLDEQEME